MPETGFKNASTRKAYLITRPTSGIGRATALATCQTRHVMLVGRESQRLDDVKKIIDQKGQSAASVLCDLSDISSVRRAASEIIALNLPKSYRLSRVACVWRARLLRTSSRALF